LPALDGIRLASDTPQIGKRYAYKGDVSRPSEDIREAELDETWHLKAAEYVWRYRKGKA
jgi:hypothetical protein